MSAGMAASQSKDQGLRNDIGLRNHQVPNTKQAPITNIQVPNGLVIGVW
jgi:hypothetical protein